MTNKEELRDRLWQEVMEDYVLCAELGHLAVDQAKHKIELRGHLARLTDFFWNEIEQIRKADMERVKQAFIQKFLGAGELWFPYVSDDDKEKQYAIEDIEELWEEVLSIIKQDENKN